MTKLYLSLLAGAFVWMNAQAQTPQLIKHINQTGHTQIQHWTKVGNKIYFAANDGEAAGEELWVTDGTTAGTYMVKDINLTGPSYPANFCAFDDRAFFVANDGEHGRELWVSDGTEAGTYMIDDIYAGAESSNPRLLSDCGNVLMFTATDAGGGDPWFFNPISTEAGKAHDFAAQPEDGLGYYINWNGKIFFQGYDPQTGFEPWAMDAVTTGAYLVKDVYGGSASGGFINPFVFNGVLYFAGYTWAEAAELWTTDGTEVGTEIFHEFCTDFQIGSYSSAQMPVQYNNRFYFTAYSCLYTEVWSSNNDTDALINLVETNPDMPRGITMPPGLPGQYCYQHDKLYFRINIPSTVNNEIYRTDGDMMESIGASYSGSNADISWLTAANDSVYFLRGTYGQQNKQLYVTGGTPESLRMIPTPFQGQNPFDWTNQWMQEINGTLIFIATYGDIGAQLYTLGYNQGVGVEDVVNDLSISLYPNPTNNNITIQSDKSIEEVTVSNALGQKLFTDKSSVVSLASLPQGIYLVNVKTIEGSETMKVVKR